jgi:hypothetical protein
MIASAETARMPLSKDALSTLARGEVIAAELKAHNAGHRRYVVVRPFKDTGNRDPAFATLPWRYRIDAYEIDARLVDEHVSPDVLVDLKDVVVGDFASLEKQLPQWAALELFRDNRQVLAPF